MNGSLDGFEPFSSSGSYEPIPSPSVKKRSEITNEVSVEYEVSGPTSINT